MMMWARRVFRPVFGLFLVAGMVSGGQAGGLVAGGESDCPVTAFERQEELEERRLEVPGIRMVAGEGNALAIVYLAVMYDVGYAVKRDLEEAAYWYGKGIDRNARELFLPLAFVYAEAGKDREARRMFDRAGEVYADRSPRSELEIVFGTYFSPEDVDASQCLRGVRERANASRLVWLEGLANEGNRMAVSMMAMVYRDGIGVAPDAAKANGWCRMLKDREGTVFKWACPADR